MLKKSVKPWDLLNPNKPRSNDEIAKERYDICNWCPEFISLTKQCAKCGCLMHLKVKLEEATCPLRKW